MLLLTFYSKRTWKVPLQPHTRTNSSKAATTAKSASAECKPFGTRPSHNSQTPTAHPGRQRSLSREHTTPTAHPGRQRSLSRETHHANSTPREATEPLEGTHHANSTPREATEPLKGTRHANSTPREATEPLKGTHNHRTPLTPSSPGMGPYLAFGATSLVATTSC
jgi:hypothetical protein